MERKIGEIFEYNGEWYQCVKSPDGSCKHCDMNFGGKCPIPIKECVASARSDLSYVIFKKLEKVGEPYRRCLSPSNNIMVQRYRLYDKNVIMPDEPCMFFNAFYYTIEIEIKQTKEDMEDMEEKKLNLKPFDLEAAKEGKPVYTRDGRKARIICFDRKDNTPIVALIECVNHAEILQCVHNDGKCFHYDTSNNDLMMLPEKKEGWINIYNADTTFYYVKGRVFETKDEAVQKAKEEVEKEQREKNEYIDTIRVEWEE